MAKSLITIGSILGGIASSQNYARSDQFLSSAGIDPDEATTNDYRASGYIKQTALTVCDAESAIDAAPLWIQATPKTAGAFIYTYNGKVYQYDTDFEAETSIGTVTSSLANGCAYYDNYLYLAKGADIARYGPLDGTPSLTQDYWTSTLSLTAPSNTTYPLIGAFRVPNHQMHRHTDGKLYFCDVNSANQGIINYIKTTKTTVEGDTNDGSTYNALDFPYGVWPVCLESYGNDLVIGLIEQKVTDDETISTAAKVAFWDTTSDSFYKITSVELHDPIITAIMNVNGELYVFGGYDVEGVRISKYVGGYTFQQIAWIPEALMPLSRGAVSHRMNRFAFASYTKEPDNTRRACIYSYGSSYPDLVMGLQVPYAYNIAGTTDYATAVSYVRQRFDLNAPPVIGAAGTDFDLLRSTSTTATTANHIRWKKVIGQEFKISEIRIPLTKTIAANQEFTVKVYGDQEAIAPATSKQTQVTVNSTTHANQQIIKIYPTESYNHDFILEITYSGTALVDIALPIKIIIDTID